MPYFHVVSTLPHELSALVLQNKRLFYDLLYRISAATMLELARDPKHLGADIGFLGVLHTCRALLGATACVDPHEPPSLRCPACSAIMLVVERLNRSQLYFRASLTPSQPRRCADDSS